MSEHRLTITITPISEEELQAFIEDFRERFGRKHLVHVIGKQPSGTHLDAAPDGMDLEAQGEMGDQLAAAQAAIERVREVLRRPGHQLTIGGPEWLPKTGIWRALDGDTTEGRGR